MIVFLKSIKDFPASFYSQDFFYESVKAKLSNRNFSPLSFYFKLRTFENIFNL